jgi:L-iditol 2-dehydrogenase
MKALVKLKRAYGHLQIMEVPEPTPGPTEIKMEIGYCGICGTDVKIYHDEHAYYKPPLVLGHEFSGQVAAVGEDVSDVEIGDKVIVAPPAARPKSLYGRSRDPWAGVARRGFEAEWGFTTYGGFTKYAVCDQNRILKLPESVDLESAALLEPLSVCVHGVLGKACIHFSDIVVVSGPGPIGLLAAQLAKAEGAFVVVLGLEADQERLMLAKELGADMAINVDQIDPLPQVLGLTHGAGADVVIECAGAAPSVSQCIELSRPGGHYVQLGTSAKTMMTDFAQIAYKEMTVAGSFGCSRIDWERSLLLLDTGKVRARPLVSHKLPLSAWEEAFALAEEKRSVKVLLHPDS